MSPASISSCPTACTRLIRFWPRPLGQMQGDGLPGVEGCLFIGFHAGARSGAGTLAHSFNGSLFADVRRDGESRSEAYILAAVAGELDILRSADLSVVTPTGLEPVFSP